MSVINKAEGLLCYVLFSPIIIDSYTCSYRDYKATWFETGIPVTVKLCILCNIANHLRIWLWVINNTLELFIFQNSLHV